MRRPRKSSRNSRELYRVHSPKWQILLIPFHRDGGGWGSKGLSTLVGLATPIWCFIGPDAGAHMSEEIKDASLQLPRAMMWATFLNGVMGIIMLISFWSVEITPPRTSTVY